MIKRQLNPLRIGKGLLSLVALSVMLLAPQRAWAQTDYGLTVAGVTVTSDNATNITGQNILAGTVTYEDGSHTLTLDHATINGSVVVTGGFDLVVCLVGDNTIQGTGETSLANGISRGGGSAAGKLTFDIAKNTSGSLFFPYVTTPIAGFANIEYLNGLEWGCRDEGTTTDYVEGVGTEVVLASIGASLYVTKTKTTMTLSNNGGTVTYRKDDTLGHVLTLSGLTDLNNCISWYSPDDVTIEISGTNNSMSFSSSGTYNSVCFEGKPQSNISFRFTGATATLKMYDRSDSKSLEHPWISGFGNASNPTLSDGLKMVEIDEYRYDSQDNQTKHVERYITTETYGLNVKGIQVHNLEGVNVGYKDHILGLTYNELTQNREYDTSITFNSTDNILTLNNANISYTTGNAIVSSITTPLTVHLTSENSISSGDYLPFVGAIGDNANLVFTTNTTGTPGSLTMTSTHTDFGPTSFFDGFKQILYPEEQGLLAAKSVNGNVVISQETGYGLKVAGIVVTEDNASHILGENNTTVTFTPATEATGTEPAKPATLTLSNATISGIIETSKDLTVDFKGASSINLPNGDDYAFVGKNSPVLSFTNSGKNSNPLTVNGEFNGGNTKFMNGFAQESVDVDINEDRDNATVWWLESTVSAHMYLRWIEKYDLWIGDTQFTNIDSELSGGKGSFDGDHTLTLNGASLTAPIKSNLDNLTIKLKGNNSIVETSDSATLINSYKKTATLSFDVDNELGGSLTLTNRGDGASIKNFTSVSLAEGLYIHSNQAGLRYETINNEKCYVAQQNCDSWTMTINQNASYPIWVYKNSTDGYVQITETNKANVLGEQTETKSVTYDDGTLTLNSATINSGDNYAFVMGDNMTALNVVLVGVNTVTGNGFQFTTSPASLKFKTNGTDAGSLAIVDAQNTNYSLATTTVEGGNVTTAYENGLVYNSTNKTVSVVSYGLTVAGTAVTNANMGNVLGDGTVSFALAQDATETTPATPATLTLNGADISDNSISYSGAEDLTIAIKDNNQVFSINYNGNENDIPELTITKASGATDCSLALNSKGDGCVISGFSSVTWTGLNTKATTSTSIEYNTSGRYLSAGGEAVTDVIFTTAEVYPLWVGGIQVDSDNKNHILGNNNETVTFDASSNKLTLNGAQLGHEGSENPEVEPEYMEISSSLPSLTIHIIGENSIYGGIMGNSEMSTCTLTFAGDNGATLDIAGSDGTIWDFSEVITDGTYLKSDEPLNWYNKGYWGVPSMTVTKEVCYPIWVYKNAQPTGGYVQITAESSTNVLGEGEQTETKSVTYDDGTLTLTDATINSGSNYAFVMGDNMSTLNVVLVGENTVTGNGFQFTASSPSLTFKTNGTDAGSLAIVDAQGTNYSFAATTVEGGSVNDPNCENGLVYNSTNKTVSVVSYGLIIANVEVTSANMGNVLKGNATNDGKVSFTPASDNNVNILTLNGATLTAPVIVGLSNLTIDIQGTNSITTNTTCIQKKANTTPNVTFKSTSDIVGSLTLKNTSTESTTGVNNVGEYNEGSFSISNELTLILKKDGYVYSNDYYFTDGSTKEAVLAPAFGIMIGELPVNIGNADDVRGDGKISFNNESSTLTLNGATINSGDNYAFVMGDNMAALNVVLVGENTVTGNGFQFTASSPSLTFKTNGTDAGSLAIVDAQNTNYNLATTDAIIYQNGLVYDAGTKTVGALSAPTFLSDWNGETGKRMVQIQGQSQGTIKYSLTYADSKLSTKNVSNQEYSAAFPLLGPATIKATVTVGEVVSPEATAYYFGILPNPLKFVYDGQTAPAFTATLYPSVDGVSFTLSGSPGDFVTLSDGNMTITGFGSGKASALINAPETRNFIVLADTIGFMMEVVPPAPTIAFDETKTYLNSDKVNISLPVSLQNDVNATIKYSWVETCKPENGDNYDSNSKVELNAGTNTLYAWVRHNGATADDAVYSERVSQTFTVKTDINQYAVKDLIASELTYTGTTIVPSFTLYDEKEPTSTISSSNYNVRIEKYMGESASYSVVGSIVNVGTYRVYAVGKGSYGGEKLIYEALEVKKANITGLTVEENEELVYDGTEQDLVTVSNVPSGATVKYYFRQIDEEDFEDGSFNMICEPNDEDYTTTLPTSTNAGYFGIVYMVDGGNNYNKIEATATMKVAIYPAEITSVTLDKTSMAYTGTAQTVTITSVKAGTDDSLDVPSTGYTVTLDGVTVTGDITAKDVKEYTVAVTGKGNFTGTVSATFTIVNRTLAAEDVTFNNHWSTFYSADGAYELPEGIGAYVATGAGENSVTVTQISNIPEKVAVLLNDETTTTSTAVFGTDVKGNMLVHATNAKEVTAAEGDFYGLFNGRMKRVMGTIPAGKNYLLIPAAVNVNAGASQLTIVIDGETTDVNDVRSKMEDVRGDLYDLQGRKVQKPSKKGLYIQKGRKVVNK